MDKYQERYNKHQARKKKTLTELIKLRHSERIFGDAKLPIEIIKKLTDAELKAPSSCNRKAIELRIVDNRDDKSFLGGLLVGGVGWIHRASHIILFVSNDEAYKENLDYMKYLDAGFSAAFISMKCVELDLAHCFVNPNIRPNKLKYFKDYFNIEDGQTLVGTIAIGEKTK